MAEEPPPRWKAMYRSEAARALQGCVQAKEHLAGARTDLASPPLALDTRDAQGRHTLLRSAMAHIEGASLRLSGVMYYAGVVELLVLHGCGDVPSEPVAGIGDLRHHHDEWLALTRLQGAREHAQDALRGVEAAFTILDAVGVILLQSQIPDSAQRRQAMEHQLHAAADQLQAVVASVANMSALASLATNPPIGGARIQFQ